MASSWTTLLNKVKAGAVYADQGVIAGCAGGCVFDNLCAAADLIGDRGIGTGAFAMSAYPASQPVFTALIGNGVITKLLSSGVTVRSAFCGPCFGAGDVPSNGAFSIRHTTRNFPNRGGFEARKRTVCICCAYGRAFNRRNCGKRRKAYISTWS